MNSITGSRADRLKFAIDHAWEIFFARVTSGRIVLNRESSMQLHYSAILHGLGELMCIEPKELFDIELESAHEKFNIDITCSYENVRAAIELKCFRKRSNRAVDIDMYDVLKDIERLLFYSNFQIKRFICLTDNPYYSTVKHTGHASIVSIRNGVQYTKDIPIVPSWIGRWKDQSRDKVIHLSKDVNISWTQKDGWYYLKLDL